MSKAKDDAIYYIAQAKDRVADIGKYEIDSIDNFIAHVTDYLNDALESVDSIEEDESAES